MNYITKRHIIKIPTDISVYYCITNHIVIFENSFIRKVLRLKTRLIFENDKKILKITRESLSSISNNEKKKIKSHTGNSSRFNQTNAFRNFTFFL